MAAICKFNAGNVPVAAQQSANYVKEVVPAPGGPAEDFSYIVAIKRGAGSEFLKHSAKVLDANRHQLRDIGSPAFVRPRLGKLNPKARHRITEPKIPGFGIIGGHPHTRLGSGAKLVANMCVH